MLPPAFDEISHSQWDFMPLHMVPVPEFPKQTSPSSMCLSGIRRPLAHWPEKQSTGWGDTQGLKELAVHGEDRGLNLLLSCKH